MKPIGWSEDNLSAFLDAAFSNQLATYENKRSQYLRLRKIDDLFHMLLEHWTDPPSLLEPLLFYRAHSAFKTASQLGMAGQLAESMVLQRACLEYGGYAVRMAAEPTLREVWLRRDDNKQCAMRVRKEFTHAKVRDAILSRAATSSSNYDFLYSRCIDWGAHPNEKSVTMSGRIRRQGKAKYYEQTYLHGDGKPLGLTLRSVMQCGVCVIDLFHILFVDRVNELKLEDDVKAIRLGL